MGKVTGISWCDHTFSPWWGCFKVSPGCQHCYAETLATRFRHNIWGPPAHTARRLFPNASRWGDPIGWNAQARQDGVRRRVFSGSMCDVFEDHPKVGDSREEAKRMRNTLKFETGAESRCYVRAEMWDVAAAQIAYWERAMSEALAVLNDNGTSTLVVATPESTGPERVNTLGGSPQEQGAVDSGACEPAVIDLMEVLKASLARAKEGK